MEEIHKADPKFKRNSFILIFTVIVLAFITHTDSFKSLIMTDKTGIKGHELNQAHLSDLVVAQGVNLFFLLWLGYFAANLIIIAKRTLAECRYPPTNSKTAVDTKVCYGKKAKINAYLLFLGSCLLLLTPILNSVYLFTAYTTFEEFSESSLEFETKWLEQQNNFIKNNPNSPQTAYYLYKQENVEAAKELIEKLIYDDNDEARYAKHSLNLKGELYKFNKSDSIIAMQKLCSSYIQPCLTLADYYIDLRDFDKSYSYLQQIKHIEHHEIYSKLMWLYSVQSWHLFNKDKAMFYASKLSSIKKFDCGKCTLFSLTKYKPVTN